MTALTSGLSHTLSTDFRLKTLDLRETRNFPDAWVKKLTVIASQQCNKSML
jgi:hypothetical protein